MVSVLLRINTDASSTLLQLCYLCFPFYLASALERHFRDKNGALMQAALHAL